MEARFQYGMEWWQVSLLIASYQLSRAVANGAMPRLGHVVGHAAGVAAGLAGYLAQGASSGRVQLFWASVMAVGARRRQGRGAAGEGGLQAVRRHPQGLKY